MWSILTRVLGVVLVGMLYPSIVFAEESFHSFAKPDYYLGANGKPPSLEEFATNPQHYFRSKAAYQAFLQHVGGVKGTTINDTSLRVLLLSTETRIVSCTGTITTAGYNTAGNLVWFSRPCYKAEDLIQIQTTSGWHTVTSLGCLNPVRAPLPSVPKCRWVPATPQQRPAQSFSSPSFGFTDDCGDYFQFGGTQTVLPPTTITGSRLVCD